MTCLSGAAAAPERQVIQQNSWPILPLGVANIRGNYKEVTLSHIYSCSLVNSLSNCMYMHGCYRHSGFADGENALGTLLYYTVLSRGPRTFSRPPPPPPPTPHPPPQSSPAQKLYCMVGGERRQPKLVRNSALVWIILCVGWSSNTTVIPLNIVVSFSPSTNLKSVPVTRQTEILATNTSWGR